MSKLCVTCKHYCKIVGCVRNCYDKINLETGDMDISSSLSCGNERKPHPILKLFFDFCGPEGKYYIKDDAKHKLNNYDWLYNEYIIKKKDCDKIADDLGVTSSVVVMELCRNNLYSKKRSQYS